MTSSIDNIHACDNTGNDYDVMRIMGETRTRNVVGTNIGQNLRAEIMGDLIREEMVAIEDEPTQFPAVNAYKQLRGALLRNVNVYAGQTRTKFSPKLNSTTDPKNKTLYIKSVLLMTFTMFLFTGILVMYVMIASDVKQALSNNVLYGIFIPMTIFFFIDYAFVCVKCTRVGPCNFVCLCITVLSLSTVAATVSAATGSVILIIAMFITAISVLVSVFLTCTKLDFTSYKLYVAMLCSALIAITFIVIILASMGMAFDPLTIILLLVITFVQIVLIVMQLQSMLWGTTVELQENDYALGAFMLYASIFDIFMKMLQIAGITRDMDDGMA